MSKKPIHLGREVKISELIRLLERAQQQYGDIVVDIVDGHFNSTYPLTQIGCGPRRNLGKDYSAKEDKRSGNKLLLS